MPQTPVPEHVFVSYAHQDEMDVKKIVANLEKAGINVWIDQTGLQPGTSSWQEAIRDAISRSFALLLIASPNTIRSRYVPDELSVAESYECPIYPIWIAGTRWIDSIPLGRGLTQYIDCRDSQYDPGLSQAIEALKKVIEGRAIKHYPMNTRDKIPQGYFSLKFEGEQVIALRPGSYQTLRSLLDDLYRSYLVHRYLPYTYGKDWLMGVASDPHSPELQLVVPWWWMQEREKHRPISQFDAIWANSLPASYGLVPGAYCRILDLPVSAFGIATDNPRLKMVLNDFKKLDALLHLLNQVVAQKHGVFMDDKTLVMRVSPDAIHSDQFRYQMVCTHPDKKMDGEAFVVDKWWIFEID